MAGSLPLKVDWWEQQCGEDRDGEEVMELHIVHNARMGREADGAPDIQNLTDTQLDEKIDRLKKLVDPKRLKLADGGRKLDINLTKHIDEKNLRSRTTQRKIIVVLDEDDEKPKRQYQAHRISARRKKDIRIYYPERDHPESVEICLSDMDCLAPFSYLSSAIMNFYIQYLQRSEFLRTEHRNDYHFFNTFFYSKLEEALESQSKQEDGNSFAKLRRWFKGVNIFEKAYIFFPIHACQHWSLAIISIPAREYEAGPIILHLDSLGLHTSRTIFENIRSYLKAEWEHLKHSEVQAEVPIAEKIWKELPLKIEEKQIQVPQQENDYDCGLFVLFFMERFIEEAPPRLGKTDLDRFGSKWFRPVEASHLRDSIRVLLEKHFKEAEKSIQDTKDDDSLPVVLEDLE